MLNKRKENSIENLKFATASLNETKNKKGKKRLKIRR